MKIGNIELGPLPLFLAPMEDVTYKSFRYMCKKYGADVMYTEFVSSEALIRDVKKTKLKMTLRFRRRLPFKFSATTSIRWLKQQKLPKNRTPIYRH
jgi:tRNA-dihydrouridine synthase